MKPKVNRRTVDLSVYPDICIRRCCTTDSQQLKVEIDYDPSLEICLSIEDQPHTKHKQKMSS